MKKLLVLVMMIAWSVVTALPGFTQTSGAQSDHGSVEVQFPVHQDVSPPLKEIQPIKPDPQKPPRVHRKPLRKFKPSQENSVAQPSVGNDPVAQLSFGTALATTLGIGFDGVGYPNAVIPPDANGAPGRRQSYNGQTLNQYVQWVNESFAIFDKGTGSMLYGPAVGNTLWTGFGGPCETTNDGDPIVQYDKAADRWVMMQLSYTSGPSTSGPSSYQCVAVSTTPDATGSYNRYYFKYDSDLNDYPKFGVWPDGYYVSFNMFNRGSNGNFTIFLGPRVCAYDRAAMLGNVVRPATQQCVQLSPSYGGVLPADLDGATPPPAGSPNFFLAFTNPYVLELRKFHVDWTTPNNTTLSTPLTISVPAFTEPCAVSDCIPQAGTTQQLEALGDRLMYRLAYRHFTDGHEALVVNHSVQAANNITGVRWYELRNPTGATMASGTPVLYQQGTYAPDSTHRWMGSMAMDNVGNIAVGYSVSSSTIHPGIRYTGRSPDDPLGLLGVETSILEGSGSQNYFRWGDYSSLTIDPTDDCTLWYTNEYLKSDGNVNTRIASFNFTSCGISPALINLNPIAVVGGNPSTGTVTLSGQSPTGGAVVTLTSSNTAVATVPSTVTVAAGATSATFTVTTSAVTASTAVTISATYGGVTKTTALTVTPRSSPYGGTPWAIPGRIEAENYDVGGEGVAYHDTEAANLGGQYRPSEGVDIATTTDTGGGYLVGWMQAGEWLKYTVNVQTAGTYTLAVRVAANGQGGTFHIEVDGIDKTGPLTVPNTGGWDTWQTLTRTGVSLSAGVQVLRLVLDSNGSTIYVGNVNYLDISAGSSSSPYGGTPWAIPGRIEAENFDVGGEGVAYHDTEPANLGGQYRLTEGVDIAAATDTGGGYLVGWMLPGEWLKYTVNVTATGTYTLAVRVAANGQGGTFHIEVNGIDKTGPLTVPNTGGWNTWQTITKTGVSLSAGVQVLRFVLDSNGSTIYVGNMNYLDVSLTSGGGPFTKVQLLVPGETAAPGSVNGKTGTPTAQTAGTPFNMTVNAVDANWNLINTVTDTIQITASDAAAVLPANAALVSGTKTFSVTLKTAGTATIKAADVTDTTKTPNTSPLITVTSGSSSSPYGGTPWAIPGRIEAENYDVGGEGVAYHDFDASNNGGQYRLTEGVDIETTTDTGGGFDVGWMGAGEWLKYTVNVTATGTYTLAVRVAANGQGGTFHIEVNGTDITGPLTVPNTGGWETWQTVTKTGVSLSAGVQVLRLVLDSNGSSGYFGNVNYLDVSAGSSSSPYGGTPWAIPGRIEAENYDVGGEGVAYHDLDASNNGGQYRPSEGVDIETTTDTGGGFDVGWMQAGEWLKYTVNVQTAGTYTLAVRVAANGQGGTFHIEVNGIDKTGPLTVPNTGGWETWQTLTKTGVSLSAGVQVLRLVLDSNGSIGSVGNVNYIDLN